VKKAKIYKVIITRTYEEYVIANNKTHAISQAKTIDLDAECFGKEEISDPLEVKNITDISDAENLAGYILWGDGNPMELTVGDFFDPECHYFCIHQDKDTL
jgi:hypothetical protein